MLGEGVNDVSHGAGVELVEGRVEAVVDINAWVRLLMMNLCWRCVVGEPQCEAGVSDGSRVDGILRPRKRVAYLLGVLNASESENAAVASVSENPCSMSRRLRDGRVKVPVKARCRGGEDRGIRGISFLPSRSIGVQPSRLLGCLALAFMRLYWASVGTKPP